MTESGHGTDGAESLVSGRFLFSKSRKSWDFPGCSMAKTSSSQCRGPRFNPWSGNWIPYAATKSSMPQLKIPNAENKDPMYHS